MSRIEETYRELQEKKKERKELAASFKDELKASSEYERLCEELKTLRGKKKGIENDIKSRSLGDARKLEELALEIRSEEELLSDLSLNAYLSGEKVEIADEYSNTWVPHFKVTFRKR
ncbi:MAG: hypothetical protein AAB886_01545 [Patescibacteria group bacterium]